MAIAPEVILRSEQNGHNPNDPIPPLERRPDLLHEAWLHGFTRTLEGWHEWGKWEQVHEEPHNELWELDDNVSTILTVRGRWRRDLGDGHVEYLVYPEQAWSDLGRPFFSQISQMIETEIHYVDKNRSLV